MSTMKGISGPASNVRQETEVTGAVSGGDYTSIRSQKVVDFRVDRTPMTMKLGSTIDIAGGDPLTVAGTGSGGGLNGIAVRNDSTNVIYSAYSPLSVLIWAAVLIVVGFATLAMFVGFILLPLGVYLVYKGMQLRTAFALLERTEPAAPDAVG